MSLTYPWYTYPSVCASPYYDLKTYQKETIRLLDHIKFLRKKKLDLVHLTIGAAMEEAFNNGYKIGSQWRQLYPVHTEEYTGPVEIIIVSPNEEFANEKYTPLFVKNTWHTWEKKGHTYTCKNITINIFCTMFPHIDHRNNKIIDRILKKHPKNTLPDPNDYRQSSYDVKFIQNFYECLSDMFDHANYVTCFSFAVFRKFSLYSRINNFAMFSEIVELFKKKNRIIGEWIFDKNITYVVSGLKKINYTGYYDELDIVELATLLHF